MIHRTMTLTGYCFPGLDCAFFVGKVRQVSTPSTIDAVVFVAGIAGGDQQEAYKRKILEEVGKNRPRHSGGMRDGRWSTCYWLDQRTKVWAGTPGGGGLRNRKLRPLRSRPLPVKFAP